MDYKKELQNIYDEIVSSRQSLIPRRKNYEEINSLSMSYLTTWVILESSLKNLFGIDNKKQLIPRINEWKEYLDENLDKQPNKITNTEFTLRPFNIPTIKSIEKIIGETKYISEVIQSGSKYRVKRNNISHMGEEFGRLRTYQSYITVLDKSLNELETKLRNKISKL